MPKIGDEPHAQRRGWLKNGNQPGDFSAAPRCGAKTRRATRCQCPAMKNGRCRLHGGLSTGPRTPEGQLDARGVFARDADDAGRVEAAMAGPLGAVGRDVTRTELPELSRAARWQPDLGASGGAVGRQAFADEETNGGDSASWPRR